MKTQIKIMNLDIDIISIRNLAIRIRKFLREESFNVILFASTDLIEEIDKNEELKELMSKAELILPQDETLLSLHHVDTLKEASMVVSVQYIATVFDKLSHEDKTMYVLATKEKEAKAFEAWITQWYPNMRIIGSFYEELEQNKEVIINEINSLVPDILLCLADSPEQERFLLENKSMINAKLAIALGNENLGLIKMYKQTIRGEKLGLIETFYYKLIQSKEITKLRNVRMFKRKFENYKNKKGGKYNGDNE